MSVSMIGPALNGIIPVICVTLAGIACMLAEAFRERDERMPIGGLGLIGLVGAGAADRPALGPQHGELRRRPSPTTSACSCSSCSWSIGVLTILFSPGAIERDQLPAGEYYALLLFALAGMMLMAIASDLLIIFLTLEVFSIAIYVMTGLRREVFASTEGAFKYFLLGGFSSAFFLYGIAFTYGLVGSTHLDRVGRRGRRAVADRQPAAARGARACCSSASRSRCRRCRSTCGRPTPTKARRPS